MPTDERDSALPQRRGAKSYFVAIALAQLCALSRYTLLARILGPEQLGLAATLILTASFFDTVTDSGSDRFLIQDKAGDSPAAQRLVHLVYLVRGVCIAAILFFFAAPIAALYKSPQAVPGLMLLALSPLVMSLIHMDVRRSQRHNDFRSEGAVTLAGEFFSLLATAAAALLIRDFIAVAFGLIARSLAMVTISHLRSERPYKIGYDKTLAPRLARFGLPLMVNGLLLFMGSQTDRLVVVDSLGLAQLGRYSAVLLLIFYPSQTIVRFLASLHLPRLATARNAPAALAQATNALAGQTSLLAVGMVAGFALVAPTAVVVLDGAKFAQSAAVVALIGAMQATRFMRVWPTTMALAMGRSDIVLVNTLIRLISIPAAFLGVATVGGLEGVAIGFAIGEIVALAGAMLLLNRAFGNHPMEGFDRLAIFVFTVATVLIWVRLAGRPTIGWGALALGCSMALIVWIIRRESSTLTAGVELARSALRLRGARTAS